MNHAMILSDDATSKPHGIFGKETSLLSWGARYQLERISMKFPVRHMAKALVSAFGSFYRTICTLCAPDFNRMLQALK
jgi:hypothetical protein